MCPSALDGEAAPFGAASTALSLASAPPCHFRTCLPGRRSRQGVPSARWSSSLLVHMWARCRVLATWGPLLVPCSLCSSASEILSFFSESFEVVRAGFLPPTAGHSLIGGTSACSGPLLRVTALLSGLWAGDCSFPAAADRLRTGMGGRLSSPPPFVYFYSSGLGLQVLASAGWACFPPGWNGGFHLWRLPCESLGRGRAFFKRLILPDLGALGAGLPGLPGSWSLELLPPSCSGCVQLPLPPLFITPFAILVFNCENFGFEGVDGVFGS